MTGNLPRPAALLGILAVSLATPALARTNDRPQADLVLAGRPVLPNVAYSDLVESQSWPKLDPSTYREVGDIRIGETVVEPQWAGPIDAIIPVPTWAMSLAHAAKLMELWDVQLTGNQLLAFAVEESALGCDPTVQAFPYQPEVARNGCFNIDADFDYAALQSLFPARFSQSFADTVGGDHFEGSALAFAYIAAMHGAELEEMGYAVGQFYRDATDPDALLKVTGLTHALGSDNSHTERIFDTERDFCLDEASLSKSPVDQSCITNVGSNTYVRSVADHASALASPSAPIYNGLVSWSDVLAYLDTITPIYPEATNSTVRNKVRTAFDREAGSDGQISFADGFGDVLDALILALPAPENVDAAVKKAWGNDHDEDDDDQGEDEQ